MNSTTLRLTWLLLFSFFSLKARTQTVTLDYFFNNEYHKKADGSLERFHYTWEDKANTGFSIWGDIIKKNGGQLKSLESAPSKENLKGTDVYIIVDPDTKKETAHPNYIEAEYIKVISEWVKAGGVLVMLANDSANVELEHFNHLAAVFGIHFNLDLRNMVIGEQFETGALNVQPGDTIFRTAKKIYLKDICTLSVATPAKASLRDNKDIIIATSNYGKGTVFAVGDPWLYNEYCNGRLPTGYDNDKAADDLTKWLFHQVSRRKIGSQKIQDPYITFQ